MVQFLYELALEPSTTNHNPNRFINIYYDNTTLFLQILLLFEMRA